MIMWEVSFTRSNGTIGSMIYATRHAAEKAKQLHEKAGHSVRVELWRSHEPA